MKTYLHEHDLFSYFLATFLKRNKCLIVPRLCEIVSAQVYIYPAPGFVHINLFCRFQAPWVHSSERAKVSCNSVPVALT